MAIDKNKAIANAQRFTQKGQLDRALKEYQAIVAEDPEDVRIWLKIGDLFTKKGTVPQAVSTYARVAVYYSERGFFLKAVAVWKQILNIDPSYFEAHLKLAELYVQLGLAPDAIGQYQLVVGSYEREGRHRDSVALLKKIVELAPEDIPNRIRLAEAFARQNENPKAVEEFKVVLEQLHQRERWDEAIQVGERVAYLAPEDTENLRLVSEVYLRRGDARRALARLQACFKAAPTDIPTLELLARAFTELGQIPKAVSVHRELARLHEESENPAARLEAFRRILALDPTDVEAISVTGGGRPREVQAPLPQQVLFSQGITSTQGMQRLGAIAQPVELLSPEDQIRRHMTDIDLLLKYGLGEHALQTTDKILAVEPENEAALVKRKDIAIAIGRRDEAIAAILRLAGIAEKRSPEAAMTWLGEALQISPHHNEANQRMQRLSSGMAAGLRRSAATGAQSAIVEMSAPDDYPDLDLGALDFGDDGGLDAGASIDASDMPDLELDFDGDELAPPPASAPPREAAVHAGEIADVGEDDFGGLNDVGDDEFLDLLSGENSDPGPPAPAPDASGGEDDFGGLLGDDDANVSQELPTPSPAEPGEQDDEDFGGLLVGPRLSNPTAPVPVVPERSHESPLASAATPVRGLPLVTGISGAPTPQPLADDFGDLGPMELPDDDFSDLLSDEIPPRGGAANRGDEFDFGELMSVDLPAEPSFDEQATPVPSSPVAPPAPASEPPPAVEAGAPDDMDFGDLLPHELDAPPVEPQGAEDPDTSFNLGDLLPADLQEALDEAEADAVFARSQAETPVPGALPPVEASAEAADDAAGFHWDDDADASFDAPAPTVAVSLESMNLPRVDDAAGAGEAFEFDLPDFGAEVAADEFAAPAEGAVEAAAPEFGDLRDEAPSVSDEAEPEGPLDFDIDFDAPLDADGDADASIEQPAPTDSWSESFEAPMEQPAGPEVASGTPAADAEAVAEAADLQRPADTQARAEEDEGSDFDFDADFGAAPARSEPEIEEPAFEHAPATSEVSDALGALIDEGVTRASARPPVTDDVAAALSELLPAGRGVGAPIATEAVSEAFSDLSDEGDYEDPDRTVFAAPEALTGAATASPNLRKSEPAAPQLPVSFSPPASFSLPASSSPPPERHVVDEDPFDVEMEVASLPGVDMGLSSPDELEPIEELDDIELLEDDLDIVEDDAASAEGEFDFDEPVPARRPMIDSRTVVAAVTYPDIDDELAEVDFLIESSLAADARDALEDLASQHGIGHPSIQARLARINEIEAIAHEAERAVAFMGASEPTPVAPLAASGVDDLSDADVAAHFDLGVAYMEMGQYKKAITQLQKVASHRERRAEALRVIALCELQQGNPQAAVKSLEDALAVPGVPRDGRVGLLYDLATAYEGIGNRIAARTQLKAILELGAGDFLDVRERLTRLTGA